MLKFKRCTPDSELPFRAGPNEVGYDLTLISIIKSDSHSTMYDTGIIVIPPDGYHTEIVPRSSFSKTGYVMANSVGVIDPTYRGTLRVVLIKVNKDMPDIELPYRGFQLIVRKTEIFPISEVEIVDNTYRGEGGFGSTDKK